MNKFKYALIAIMIMITCKAQAQFTLGYRADIMLTGIHNNDDFLMNTKRKFGIQFGIIGDYMLSSSFSIYSGILYSQQGYKTELSFLQTNVSTTTNLNYVRFPLKLQYKYTFDFNENLKLLFCVGPYIGHGFGGNLKGVSIESGSENGVPYINKTDINKKISMGKEVDKDFKSFDFGYGVALGLQYSSFQSRISFSYGLTDISNSSKLKSEDPIIAILEEVSKGKIKNHSVHYSITYRFGKHKNQ